MEKLIKQIAARMFLVAFEQQDVHSLDEEVSEIIGNDAMLLHDIANTIGTAPFPSNVSQLNNETLFFYLSKKFGDERAISA